tara:strand:- start:39 stop:659 length:621 start_codon:yes stop_codon:yes gene_type:complete
MTVQDTNSSAKFERFVANAVRPVRLQPSEVEHFLFGRGVIHGVVTKADGRQVNQIIARFLVDPDNKHVAHIHFFTDSLKTARKIAAMLRPSWQPWRKDNPRRRKSTFSIGKKESWHQEPCFSATWGVKLTAEKPVTSKVTGPFGTFHETPKSEESPWLWLNGAKVPVDKVNDLLVDINTPERTQEQILQQLGWHERQAAIELERLR